jgi:hypothetical protein
VSRANTASTRGSEHSFECLTFVLEVRSTPLTTFQEFAMNAKSFLAKFFSICREAIRPKEASESKVTVFPSLEGRSVPTWRKPDRKKAAQSGGSNDVPA